MARRASLLVFAILAGLGLSGCLVTSKSLPAGSAVVDQRLVGAWRFLKEDGAESNSFLHFIKRAPDQPLRLLWIEGDDCQFYDLTTIVAGTHHVFAALPAGSLLNPPDPEGEEGTEYILGFYSVTETEVVFSLLDRDKVDALVRKGVVKGIPSGSASESPTLTASPQELTEFLASKAAYEAKGAPAKLRRLTLGR